MITTKGVYYIPKENKLVSLSNVLIHTSPFEKFVICCWECSKGTYPRMLIKKHQLRDFKRIGDL